MIKKLVLLVPILVLLQIIIPQPALAIGISPSRIVLDYEPGVTNTFDFLVLNNAGKTMKITIYKSGELVQYVNLHGTEAIVPNSEYAPFSFDFTMPPGLERGGIWDTRVGAIEALPDAGTEGASVGARTAVEMQLWVRVPYPGKYAELSLDAPDVEIGQPVNFKIKVSNLGTDAIQQATGTIEIYEKGVLLTTISTTQSGALQPGEKADLTASWTTDKAGTYKAVAKVLYDGKNATAEKEFRVGSLTLEVIDLSKATVSPGRIAKFELKAGSKWNAKVTGVYAELQAIKDNNVAKTAKSETFDVAPWGEASVPIYMETEGLAEGTYAIKATLHYADKTTSREFPDWLEVRSGAAVQMPDVLWIAIIAAAIIILVLVALSVVVHMRRCEVPKKPARGKAKSRKR